MPINPNIPLEVRPFNIDAVGALGRAIQLKQLGQHGRLQDQQFRENEQQMQIRQAQLEEQQAFGEAVRRNTSADGTINHQGVMRDLAKAGKPNALLKYRDDVARMSTNEWNQRESEIKARASAAGEVASQFSTVTSPEEWAAAKDRVKAQFAKTMPEVAAQMDNLGEYSDASKQRVIATGMSAQQWLSHLNTMRELPGKDADTRQKVRADAAAQLGAATDKAQYADIYKTLPPEVAKSFPSPEKWNPKTTTEQVRSAGMTSAQQATDTRGRESNRTSQARLDFEMKRFNASPDAKDPMRQRDHQDYMTYLTQHNVEQNEIQQRAPARTVIDEKDLTGRTSTRQTLAPAYVKPLTFEQWRQANGRGADPFTPDEVATIAGSAPRQSGIPANAPAPAGVVAAPVAPPPPATATKASGLTVGKPISVKGRMVIVTKVYPDGSFDAEPVKR
jgi:hypothetical protein